MSFKTQVQHDWAQNRISLILETIGAPAGIFAASMMAFFQAQANFILVFSIFLVSSISWLISGFLRRNPNQVGMNSVYTGINLIGFYNALDINWQDVFQLFQ